MLICIFVIYSENVALSSTIFYAASNHHFADINQ